MDFLKVVTIILFIIVTICTIKLHPEMHQPMIIEDADFQLTRISDTLMTKNIPVSSPQKIEQKTQNIVEPSIPEQTKEIKIKEEAPIREQIKYIQQEIVKPEKKEVKVKPETTSQDSSQLELLQRIIEQTEQAEEPKPEVKPEPKPQKPVQVQKTQPKQENKNPYMTEQEEIIAWNKWRSNLQNQIMRDSQIDYAPLGTIFLFTFVVDKFGNISNIKVECSNPNFMNVARDRVKPAISNLQRKPILNFPKGTQRTSTVVTGIFLIGTQERYSTPNDFSDYERVVY